MSLMKTVEGLCKNARVIFDVGAKMGDYAVEFARFAPEAVVYAFEPAPANYAELERKNHPRIVPVNAAVFHMPGPCKLNLYDHAGSHSVLLPDEWDEVKLMEAIKVDAFSVDSFCKDFDISHINFLKIDVEGAELKVLEGAAGLLNLGAIDVVMVELMFYPYFAGQADPVDVWEFLRNHGMKDIDVFCVFQEDVPVYADAIFVQGGVS